MLECLYLLFQLFYKGLSLCYLLFLLILQFLVSTVHFLLSILDHFLVGHRICRIHVHLTEGDPFLSYLAKGVKYAFHSFLVRGSGYRVLLYPLLN